MFGTAPWLWTSHKRDSSRDSLGEALHYEFKPRGVYVTVVSAALTNTPVLAKLGLDPRTMPMKPVSVEQCVSRALRAEGKSAPDRSGLDEPNHEGIGPRVREADDDGEDVREAGNARL